MIVKVAKAQCSLTGEVAVPEDLSGGTVTSYPFYASDRMFIGDRGLQSPGWYIMRQSTHACTDRFCPGTLRYATLEVA